jgi:hypothetical protein
MSGDGACYAPKLVAATMAANAHEKYVVMFS